MRLDKYLTDYGIASRREVKNIIKSGMVSVNGEIAAYCDMTIGAGSDTVYYNGTKIHHGFTYLMMNKPSGYLSTTESGQTVIALLDERCKRLKLFPAGRLDKDSEGFLILTDDGDFAHRLTSPGSGIVKTYYVRCKGRINDEAPAMFKAGIKLRDGSMYLPAELTILKNSGESDAEVRVSEGKYHQVKKMMSIAGAEVTYLKRIAIGGLSLDKTLERGGYREMTRQELESISAVFRNK